MAFVRTLFRRWRSDPSSFRHALRENQTGQALSCVPLGILVSIVTVLLHEAVSVAHRWTFGVQGHEELSNAASVDYFYIMVSPVLGGALLGLVLWVLKRWRQGEIVDPIEANAIYGGRMSLIDSARLALAALLSNASGASIGMEAAYTQMGAGVTSRIARTLGLRREDARILVAAGTAAAIGAAFNAPLAGAFYGFELVLGGYTVAALPQVAVCALTGALFTRLVSSGQPIFSLPLDIEGIPLWDYPIFVAMGIYSALLGIVTMKSVTWCEHGIRKLPIPEWTRPALGGAGLGLIALMFPQVLGSGQGAINDHLQNHWPLVLLAALLVAKIAASALCLGAGFRGGLFSASLFIGCLFGQISGTVAGFVLPQAEGQMEIYILVGMGAVAASVIGAPVTMVLLVLEMTGSFTATTAVFVGVLVASLITRSTFGYSFSTWRFHLRGLRILTAHDVGWVRDIKVGDMMQPLPQTVVSSVSLEKLRMDMPPGSARRVFVTDDLGLYLGMADVAELHAHALDNKAAILHASDLIRDGGSFLVPGQDIRSALDLFASSAQEDLPVLISSSDRRLAGYLTESYTLKRYAHELETKNLAQSGAGVPLSL